MLRRVIANWSCKVHVARPHGWQSAPDGAALVGVVQKTASGSSSKFSSFAKSYSVFWELYFIDFSRMDLFLKFKAIGFSNIVLEMRKQFLGKTYFKFLLDRSEKICKTLLGAIVTKATAL